MAFQTENCEPFVRITLKKRSFRMLHSFNKKSKHFEMSDQHRPERIIYFMIPWRKRVWINFQIFRGPPRNRTAFQEYVVGSYTRRTMSYFGGRGCKSIAWSVLVANGTLGESQEKDRKRVRNTTPNWKNCSASRKYYNKLIHSMGEQRVRSEKLKRWRNPGASLRP